MFKEWLRLQESVNVTVSGYDPDIQIRNIEDISNHLLTKLIFPYLDKLQSENPEVIEDITRKYGTIYNVVSPDDDYYRQQKPIINIYTGVFPSEIGNRILAGVKYYLDGLRIKYRLQRDVSRMYGDEVYRLTILSDPEITKDTPPEINMTNDNAAVIFNDLLGYDIDARESISAAELLIKIENLEKEKVDIHQREPYAQWMGKATTYYGGLSAEMIWQRLEQLKNLAKWAIRNGYDYLELDY